MWLSTRSSIPFGSALVLLLSAGAIASACGSSDDSRFASVGSDAGEPGDGTFADDGGPLDGAYDPDAFWAQDPPPKFCGPDAAGTPPTPGGTPACPSDKNREGCPCPVPGDTAPCWPGLRANRNLGICKDGVTTCNQIGEFSRTWGPCKNYVPPVAGATKGKEACKCFSAGQWAIKNLVPCFVSYSSGQTYGVSTTESSQCPAGVPNTPPPPTPVARWSTDTLNVDCAGHFKLCYALKAGNYAAPLASACIVASVCTESDYVQANVVQSFPDLGGWSSNDPACSASFADNGGYGEMTVKGLSALCDDISDNGKPYVFHRVQYCPKKCNVTPAPVGDPDCVDCMAGGTGQF